MNIVQAGASDSLLLLLPSDQNESFIMEDVVPGFSVSVVSRLAVMLLALFPYVTEFYLGIIKRLSAFFQRRSFMEKVLLAVGY